MRPKYIDAKTFEEFCVNQKELINILNHNMSALTNSNETISKKFIGLSTDVSWMKKILWAIFGVGVVSLVTIIVRTAYGI